MNKQTKTYRDIQFKIENNMLRTISEANKNHADKYAYCDKCKEVYIDDIVIQGDINCPRCKVHTLNRGIEKDD